MRDRRTARGGAARRVATLIAALSLGVLTAAYAATGSFPLHRSAAAAPTVRLDALAGFTAEAGGLAGMAVANMQPGTTRTAALRVTNAGDAAGVFRLSSADRTDLPAGLAEPLSTVVSLTVLSLTAGSETIAYQGPLADLGSIDLGTLGPGDQREYRFVVRYPTGRPDALDNALQHATTSVTWAIDATVGGTPRKPTAPSAPAVVPRHAGLTAPRSHTRVRQLQRLRGRAVRATLWCSQACTGRVSGVLRVGPRRPIALHGFVVRLRPWHRRAVRLTVTRRDATIVARALRARQSVRVRIIWRVGLGGAPSRKRADGRLRR